MNIQFQSAVEHLSENVREYWFLVDDVEYCLVLNCGDYILQDIDCNVIENMPKLKRELILYVEN